MTTQSTAPNTTPVTTAELDALLVTLQAPITSHFAAKYPTLTPTLLTYECGKRYAKIIANNNGSGRSVFGFVDMTNGDLLKAASWRGPTKNFARGNVRMLTESTWIYSIG